MPILFALVFVTSSLGGYMGSRLNTSTRVGVYEKFEQCKKQGQNLVKALEGNEVETAYFVCVPVNG